MAVVAELLQVLRLAYEPSEVFWEVKRQPPARLAFLILALVLAMRVFGVYCTGFHFSTVNPEDASLIGELFRLFVPLFSWMVGVYAVSTIMDGEGTLYQLFVAFGISLFPYVLLTFPEIVLTNVLTLESALWVRIIQVLKFAWCAFLVFTAIEVVCQYEVRSCLVVSGLGFFLTIVAWALVGIIYSYTSQFVDFIKQVLIEIAIR